MEKTQKIKLLTFFIIAAVFFIVFSASVQAASLYFFPSSGTQIVGAVFAVNVYVSSADQAMNAASGAVSFPKDKLEVVSLSKSGSIISLWVQEPNFSNVLGTINFEGIVLNPGFTGSSGKIISINFRAKASGTAALNFSSGSILANDGQGTNILKSLEKSSFNLVEATPATPKSPPELETAPGTPSAPQISSPTHPDSGKWYSEKNPKFVWQIPQDVLSVKLSYDKFPNSQPAVVYSPPISEKQLENIQSGVWYFHCQLKNKIGWGKTSHFKFQIDNIPPLAFKVEVKEGKETTNPRPTLIFETIDELSGVDYYEVKIDQNPSVMLKETEYQMPIQDLGKHTIIVKATDRAGNETLAMTEINILPIDPPVITDYPKTIFSDAMLSIKGTAAPENKINIYIQKGREEPKIDETKSDKEGKWFYTGTEALGTGIYRIWAEAKDLQGAKSKPSEKVIIRVAQPAFIQIGQLAISYLVVIITLLFLILGAVCGIIWSWGKIIRKRKRLKTEISEAEKSLYYAFKTLKEEIEKQIAKLDGKPDLSDREKKIYNELKKP